MTWAKQALHVASKDMRMLMWFVVTYSAVVAIAAYSTSGGEVPLGALWGMLVFLMGLLLVGTAVQADSPLATDALWLTLPLQRSAVFGAKVVFALGLVLIAAIGYASSLIAHQVSIADFWTLLTAGIATQLDLLILAALIAAVTSTVSAFFVVFIVGFIATGTVASAVDAWQGDLLPHAPLLLQAVQTVFALLIGLFIYRARRAGLAAVLIAVIVAVNAAVSGAMREPSPDDLEVGQPSVSLAVPFLEAERSAIATPAEIHVTVKLRRAVPAYRYNLTNAQLVVTMPDGAVETLTSPHRRELYTPVEPMIAGARWMTERDGWNSPSTGAEKHAISFEGPEHVRAAIQRGDVEMMLHGTIEVIETYLDRSIPFREGAAVAYDGKRVEVSGFEQEAGKVRVKLKTSHITRNPTTFDTFWSRHGAFEYALIDHAKGEAVPLKQRSSSGTGLGFVVTNGNGIWSTLDLLSSGPMQVTPSTQLGIFKLKKVGTYFVSTPVEPPLR